MNDWAATNPDAIREDRKKNHPGWKRTYELLLGQTIKHSAFLRGIDVQKSSIDRVIKTSSGAVLNVQEKDRRIDYSDFLIELRHVYSGGAVKPGWGKESGMAQRLLYVVWPDNISIPVKATLLDYPRLSVWFSGSCKQLANMYGIRSSTRNNDGYRTDNIAVPWSAIPKALILHQCSPWFDTRRERHPQCDDCGINRSKWVSLESNGKYRIVCKACGRFIGYKKR